MKLTQGLAALLLLASAAVANAEVTGTLSAVSDYNWRGVTQTSQDPALQGSIDYAHDSGFYAGVWGSNVDFGDCCDENIETDLYAGFSGGEDVTWDFGIVYYYYPGADDLDFPEVYAGLGYKWLSGKLSYSSDFGPVRIFVCEAYHDDEQESVCQASASSPSGRSLSLS
jgi:uncharacterized protein (TIGR02001 family)